MSIHEGHRKRMKERFAQDGISGFREHEILELLLFYCIPRRNTNEIAHRLLKHFGSLPNVLNAPVRELKTVEGISDNAASFISLISQLNSSYRLTNEAKIVLKTYDECGDYLYKKLFDKQDETVMILSLDSRCQLLACHTIGQGSINSANVPIRRIVDLALSDNAATVVLAHNHPSGVALPSEADILTTKQVARALSYVDVVLSDHIIVTDDDFVSLALSRMYDPDAASAQP